MRFINSSDDIENIDQKEITEVFINKLGRPISDGSELVFAKIAANKLYSQYFILTLNNQPYDPYGVDSHRQSSLPLVLKPVNQQTYHYYISYLKTKNSLYMTRAQRSFING
jgi:hypothetical protein